MFSLHEKLIPIFTCRTHLVGGFTDLCPRPLKFFGTFCPHLEAPLKGLPLCNECAVVSALVLALNPINGREAFLHEIQLTWIGI